MGSDDEDIKPTFELDIDRGPSRMAGEERVRKFLFRVKSEDEDGQFEMDESCKKCLGEDVVIPEGQRCTASREAIAHVFGGNHQDTYPGVSKDVNFERVKKQSALICSTTKYSPKMSSEPGQHGVMLSHCPNTKPSATFVGLGEHEWLYLGDYIVFGRAILPITVWRQLPELTKRTWASNIACKDWGTKWMESLPRNQRNEEGVYEAFDTGRLTMSISVLKCVGYDLDIVSAVGEAQKGWINGTVGSAKRYARGSPRKWLVFKGATWLNTTRAGREWLDEDPVGQRFDQMTAAERRRWVTERERATRARARPQRNTSTNQPGPSSGNRRTTRRAERSPSSDSTESVEESSSRNPRGRRETRARAREPVSRLKVKESEHEYQGASSSDYEPSDID